MADIDFDELDRAVNNLMGNIKGNDSAPKPPEKVVKLEDSTPDEKPIQVNKGQDAKRPSDIEDIPAQKIDLSLQVAPEEKKETPKVVPVERPQRVAGAPRPAGGRFMDVVHPSADMKPKASSPVATSAPVKPSAPPVTTNTAKPAETEAIKDELTDDDAMITPFLPDANEKVKKRPLGAKTWPFSRQSSDEKSEKTEKAADDTPVKQAEPSEKETEPEVEEIIPINGEYSKGAKVDKDDEKGQDQRALDPTEFQETSDEEKALQSIESAEVEGPPPAEANESVRAVESGDTEHLRGSDELSKQDDTEKAGAIFDTKAYHQPLSHPKQKSGWGTIVIIVLVIAVCIGSAVAGFYFLGGGF